MPGVNSRPSRRRRFTALALPVSLALACTNFSAVPHIEANSERALGLTSAEPEGSLELDKAPSAPGADAAEPPTLDFRAAARDGDMAKVASIIAALPDAARNDPQARFAFGIATQRLGRCPEALEALGGLETLLPLLSDDILRARALCQLEVGPLELAAQYFASQEAPEDRLLAVRALLEAGHPRRALATLEGVMPRIERRGRSKKGVRRVEADARALRAAIAERLGDKRTAERDYLWLATTASTHDSAQGADEAYERLSRRALGKAQRLERATAFGRLGQVARTERELALLDRAPGAAVSQEARVTALAWANYFSRLDYAKAAELFREAARLSKTERARNLFYAARALSRTHQDEQAIVAYEELASAYPGSGYAEEARFLIARLNYGLARWAEAANAYSEYLKQYARQGRGRFMATSRYERAISYLAGGQADLAYPELVALANAELRSERRALLQHLAAVALEGSERAEARAQAPAAYRSVIADYPVSFGALASAARLSRLGHVPVSVGPEVQGGPALLPASVPASLVPPLLIAGTRGEPLPLRFPPKSHLLADVGLYTEAELALHGEREAVRREYADRADQAMCELYGKLDRGHRRYALGLSLLNQNGIKRPGPAESWVWNCVYPRPFQRVVEAAERRHQLPAALVHAVMRQESAFRADALSPVGARGLMQLMPNTAKRAAAEGALDTDTPDLTDPRQNIELGAFYLGGLISMLGGQIPLAVAAYNAGPAAVGRWLRSTDQLPLDIWIARIPYDETRQYVGKVLTNWLAYRSLTNEPVDLARLVLTPPGNTRPHPDAY